ncbi:MAG: N utilization substance protein B [Hydrogenophilales bacterium 16-64-46]|nr:MAG: N utilization substance protein B [Hydrogenophilales bacterium 12-64-13]OYZ06228.1 MAG: N utilization substance protein B [Hydrogenophilales bacterium 16-64-46]OZA38873.1 MAG: N utilization substance protein B [Hydrogenophilales bacterium 17-64-34]HQS99483.1 transcription antitermination factor NusB [Thiobacillus sp.]
MAGSRKLAREFTLQGLYAWRVGGADVTLIVANLAEDEHFKRVDQDYFRTLLYGVLKEEDLLAGHLAPALDRPIEELSPIERGILLIGSYELVHCPDVPLSVVINEGIELAKKFGGTDGHKFVNGVLDKLGREVRKLEAAGKGQR